MGQTLKKLVPAGNEETKNKEMSTIIDEYYRDHKEKIENPTSTEKFPADFYRAICEIVEKMNIKRGYTQFRVPKRDKLDDLFNQRKNSNGTLKKEEFEKIIQEAIVRTGLTGVGAKDTLIYIFGVPLTALFVKQSLMPHSIPNEYFLPGITSATAFILAKLNKI